MPHVFRHHALRGGRHIGAALRQGSRAGVTRTLRTPLVSITKLQSDRARRAYRHTRLSYGLERYRVRVRQVGILVADILYKQSVFSFAIFDAASQIRDSIGWAYERYHATGHRVRQ